MHNRLRELRGKRGWSQARLAEDPGVPRQTVNALEVGELDPGLPLAFSVARLFDRNIEALFDPDAEAAGGR